MAAVFTASILRAIGFGPRSPNVVARRNSFGVRIHPTPLTATLRDPPLHVNRNFLCVAIANWDIFAAAASNPIDVMSIRRDCRSKGNAFSASHSLRCGSSAPSF